MRSPHSEAVASKPKSNVTGNDGSFSEGSGAGRRHPPQTGRHRSSRRAPAARDRGGGPVALTGESLPAEKSRAMRYSRAHHSPGRNRSDGVRHRYRHLLRQDGANGAGPGIRQPFPESVLKIGDYLILLAVALVALIVTCALSSRSGHEHAGVRAGASGGAIPVAMPTVLSGPWQWAHAFWRRSKPLSPSSRRSKNWRVDILCSDKTGTLTLNKLTLGDPSC